MTDTIKIYRGIDELDGKDSLFAVRDDGLCAISTYMGDGDFWLTAEYDDLEDCVTSFSYEIHSRCKNPTLVREVTR